MNEDNGKSRRGPDPEDVWREILISQWEGEELSSEQVRALEIRRITLFLADVISQLMEDPTIKKNAVREAELTANYYKGICALDGLGVKKKMHLGDKPSSFNNPTKAAEWIAGQIIGIESENLPNIRYALMQAQEHSEGGVDAGGISAFLMFSGNVYPNLHKFEVLRNMVNMARIFLAADLGQSQEPKASGNPK